MSALRPTAQSTWRKGGRRSLPASLYSLIIVVFLSLLNLDCIQQIQAATSTATPDGGVGGGRRRRFWQPLFFRSKRGASGQVEGSSDDLLGSIGEDDHKPRWRRRRNPLLSMFPGLKKRRERLRARLAAKQQSTTMSSSDDEQVEEDDLSDSFSSEEEDALLEGGGSSSTTNLTLKEKRRQFLDYIALISSSFLNKEDPASLDHELEDEIPLHIANEVTPQTDLSLPGRHFHVVTTAALPWMTGTAVNPILRAAYLHRRTQQINSNAKTVDVEVQVVLEDGDTSTTLTYNTTDTITTTPTPIYNTSAGNQDDANSNSSSSSSASEKQHQQQNQQWVTLVIPWLELEEDQLELYGQVFENEQAQEDYIRNWLSDVAGMPDVACPDTGLKLLFYPARYHSGLRSIFAMGDIQALITGPVDVCVLEEPEHCNWYRAPGQGWTQKFHYVVGVVHTNYKEYASAHYSGLWTAPAIALISSAMVRAYCHQVIKLSDVLQTFAPEKEATSNVHGVRSAFLEIGMERAKEYNQTATAAVAEDDDEEDDEASNATSVYFIGKLLWAKGLDLLLELEDYYKSCTGEYFPIDIYGSGPEQKAIRKAFWGRKLVSKNNHTHAHPQEGSNGGDSVSAKMNKKHSKGRRRHRRRRHQQQNATTTTKIFTSKKAFKEHLQKFRDSLPTPEDHWRNIKESITSAKESMAELKDSMVEFPNSFAAEFPSSFAEWRRQPIPATFPGRVDHGNLGRHAKQYKVFVNPSVSEVLCTTTAEALAMGKFAIIPVHPSNTFFLKFPNCLAYRNKFEFVANLQWALTHEPEPLTPELAHAFTWEAATDRLLEASAVTWKESREREKMGFTKRDERIAWFFNELGKGPKGDIIRMILGAGPASAQVKYIQEQQNKLEETVLREGAAEDDLDDDDEEDDEEVEDEEGLTKKFHHSSFVQALRATLTNGLPSTILGSADI